MPKPLINIPKEIVRYHYNSEDFITWLKEGPNSSASEGPTLRFDEFISFKINKITYILLGVNLQRIRNGKALRFTKVLGKYLTDTNDLVTLSPTHKRKLKFARPHLVISRSSTEANNDITASKGRPFKEFNEFDSSYFTIDMLKTVLRANKIVIAPCNSQYFKFHRKNKEKIKSVRPKYANFFIEQINTVNLLKKTTNDNLENDSLPHLVKGIESPPRKLPGG